MAEPVPTNEQGPNEQSIVASGMTVEQWKKLHPGQELGPDPEEIDQATTDPTDGGPPSDEASLEMAAYFNPAVAVEGHPANVEANQRLADAKTGEDEVTPEAGGAQGSANQTPNMSPGGLAAGNPKPPTSSSSDFSSLTSHAQLDKYASDRDVDTPDDWDNKTVAAKKEWLEKNNG